MNEKVCSVSILNSFNKKTKQKNLLMRAAQDILIPILLIP